MAANEIACEMQLAAGENYALGSGYYSPITNEAYSWHYNSNGVHHIQRINGDGVCEVVYTGNCLVLNSDPKHSIEQFRATLDVDYLCNKVPGGKLKRLIWVDGTDTPIGCIDVEASIATNFFTTSFFDNCSDPCDFVNLCVPEPQGCLKGEWMPFTSADLGLSNFMLDKGFKFMWRYVYYDGRASEWSDRSSLYFQDTKGCFDSSEGFPRCIKFNIPIGNPMVEVIEFCFSEDGGITWFIAERIEKYKKYNSTQQYWYERELSERVSSTLNEDDCTFEYIFCNDKERISIDPLQVSRLVNPMPRSPQGLIRIKEGLGFYNYIKGNCPLDKIQTEKFKVALNCPPASDCKPEFSKVTVRAIIANTTHTRNQFIYREGAGAGDDLSETAKFGGLNPALDGGFEDPIPYDQFFNGKTRNFIVGIKGTDYWAEMKQWHASDHWTDRVFHGIVDDMGNEKTRNKWRKDQRQGGFFYEEAIFIVPRGTKGFFTMFSHHAEGNEPDTSTFVLGIFENLNNYSGDSTIWTDTNTTIEEIYFDTCDGDADLSSAFVIQDNAVDTGIVDDTIHPKAYALYGYLKDNDGKPVEGALVVPFIGGSELTNIQSVTDHNGFFHTYADGFPFSYEPNIELHIKVELDCGDFSTVKTVSTTLETGTNTDVGIIRITNDDNAFYTDEAYASIKVKVEDCDGNGVPGIRVALSGSKYTTTLADGFATFRIRNYFARNRSVRAVIADHNGCFTLDCQGGCNPCLNTPTSATPTCYIEPSGQTVTLSPIIINKVSAITNRKGLKNGGRYPFAIMIQGDCGIISAAYELSLNDGYIDIPKAQVSGQVQFCDLTYDGTGMVLPIGAKVLKILRGANINPFELQWLVDKIERTSDGKIKLTIQSLNDYNAKYFFKTNTIYQWLKGDRVEFIKNGDGLIFTSGIKGVLNYLVISPFNDEALSGIKTTDDANFFNQLLIEDDGKLNDLKEGALIELQRPKEATVQPTYFEICASIPIVDGELLYPIGTFSTFDTYLVNRTIGKFPGQTFEHHSPSDFWGERITDIGKAHFANKYENERRYDRNITIASSTQLNYFGDFEKTLDGQGGIIAIGLRGNKLGLALCEIQPFLFQISDDLLRVGSDNVIHAASVNQVISNPEISLRGDFGLSYDDIGSVFFGDGYALYVSQKSNVYVMHNYSFAQATGQSIEKGQTITQCHSYFKKRITDKENFNKTATNDLDKFRYATGINKNTNVVYLTIKSLRQSGINNEKEVYSATNQTIIYNPINDTFLGFASFTPEAYSTLNLNDSKGCSFLTYLNSIPYIHPVLPEQWNQFFGIFCDWHVGVTLNEPYNKQKIAISIEEQADRFFFISKVTTDKVDFISEVPPIRWKQNGNKFNASFLNNINSRGGLYNGDNCRGFEINVLFTRNNSLNLAYGTIDDSLRGEFSTLDTILIKFQIQEQSGYTENL